MYRLEQGKAVQEELLRNKQIRENARQLLSALESDRSLRLGAVARQYAMLLKSGGAEQVDFPHLNSVIAQRWSDSGLLKVKNWAWQIVFRIEESS